MATVSMTNPTVQRQALLKRSLEDFQTEAAAATPSPTNTAGLEEFEQRAESILGNLRRPPSAPHGCEAATETSVGSFANALFDLIQVASQLSQIDVMAGKAVEATAGCSQDSEEVRKWRDLSVCALEWSRAAVAKRQTAVAERLERALDLKQEVAAAKRPSNLQLASADSAPPPLEQPAVFGPPPGLAALPPPPPGFAPRVASKKVLPLAPITFEDPEELEAADGFSLLSGEGEKAAACAAAASSVAARQRAMEEFEKGGTLRAHLERMNREDQRCILVARRINRLGFQSPTLLEEYFQRFGGAKHVLVAHSRVKPSTKRPAYRIRPAGLGFVVMGSPEAAEEVVTIASHEINGCAIEMSYYKDRAIGSLELGDDEGVDEMA